MNAGAAAAPVRHVLITGASSGIGAALAEVYAAEGARLSLHGRDAVRLAEVAEKAARRGAAGVSVKSGDVRDASDMKEWLGERDAAAPLDLVIANAGISAGTGGGRESEEQIRNIMAVNVDGVLNAVDPAIPLMTSRQRGQIAIMSSLAGFHGFAGSPAYCASKAAVRVYGEGLRQLLAPEGVAVSVICPGFIRTPMTDVNRFHMPFLMPVEKAAAIIRKGLEGRRARIAFPWPMYAAVMGLSLLPQWLSEPMLSRVPRKGGA